MRRFIAAGLLTLIAILAPSVSAVAAEEVKVHEVERVGGRLTVRLSTPGGPLLASDRFRVVVNGIVADDIVATSNSAVSTPPGVVLLLDTSGSMQGAPIAEAKRAVRTFLSKIADETQVALVSFADGATLISNFTNDHDAILASLTSLRAAGETALYDGLVRATSLLDGRLPPQRNIILLSDGGDTVSTASLTQGIEAARSEGATVFGVALESPEFSGQTIREITSETGGSLLRTSDATELPNLFADLATTLASEYTLRFPDPDPRALQADIEVAVYGGPKDLVGTGSFKLRAPETAGGGGVKLPSVADIPLPFLLLVVFAATAFAAFYLSEQVRSKRSDPSKRVQWYAEEVEKGIDSDALINAAVLRRAQDLAGRLAGKTDFMHRLERDIETAGMKWRPTEVLVTSVLTALAGVLLGALLFDGFMWLLFGVVGAFSLVSTVKLRASRRRRAFRLQLPDILMLLGGALKAGYSLQQALGAVGEDARPPASEEFRRTMAEVRLGTPMDDALKSLSDRIGIVDFEWTVLAMQIQREVGGNLAEILDNIADTIRDRERLRRQVKALTAEGRLSGIVLGALPFVLAGVIAMLNPGYLTPLFTTTMGFVMVSVSSFLMVVGFFWMRKIIDVEV